VHRLARPPRRAAIDPFDEQEHSGELPARDPETSLLDADVALSSRARCASCRIVSPRC
jgi:hypothetical protein